LSHLQKLSPGLFRFSPTGTNRKESR
jgi:hypothetical protein